jgi:pimeloyl-ACP methyl ester carboxylesterase
VPTAKIDGIATEYEVTGSGPPLLMFSPGGFNAARGNWSRLGVYGRVKPVEHLSRRYSCIVFDRRESGGSGGRVERITWAHYVAQAKGLLDHLGIERAHLMGGCQGCSPVTAFAAAYPAVVASMILYWPAGGPKYRIANHSRFARHVAYAKEEGLDQVVALAVSSGRHFGEDPRPGPWATVVRRDRSFAAAFARQDLDSYLVLVAGMARTLFDRDTVAGAEPEDLLRLATPALIVPGRDPSHATSAARYLEECLPAADYWDAGVADQTERSVPPRLLEFLDAHPCDKAARVSR